MVSNHRRRHVVLQTAQAAGHPLPMGGVTFDGTLSSYGVDMTRMTRPLTGWLAAIVLAHLAVSFVHGSAHSSAGVLLSASQSAFVYIVILVAPLAGLVM